jgi:group I intron endonuclease
MRKVCGIYRITLKKLGRNYVGQSVNIRQRWATHKKELNDNEHHNNKLQRDWNKYGENAFEFVIIKRCSKHQLDFYEREFAIRLNDVYSEVFKRKSGKVVATRKHKVDRIKHGLLVTTKFTVGMYLLLIVFKMLGS